MNIFIKYGKIFDINRIKFTLSKLNWYNKHKIRVILPSDISESNVEKFVEEEFDAKQYKTIEKELFNEFKKISDGFFSNLERISKNKLPENIEVFLTKYGCGGSYHLPNRVIINIDYSKKNPIYCLKHELIHLMVEEEVRRRGLSQEEKENLVEGIFKELGSL